MCNDSTEKTASSSHMLIFRNMKHFYVLTLVSFNTYKCKFTSLQRTCCEHAMFADFFHSIKYWVIKYHNLFKSYHPDGAN